MQAAVQEDTPTRSPLPCWRTRKIIAMRSLAAIGSRRIQTHICKLRNDEIPFQWHTGPRHHHDSRQTRLALQEQREGV
eukprot:scaffold870_cov393-Prasinococcus_capsulatus_cf.AAC.10